MRRVVEQQPSPGRPDQHAAGVALHQQDLTIGIRGRRTRLQPDEFATDRQSTS
jgi:hypothetical protein